MGSGPNATSRARIRAIARRRRSSSTPRWRNGWRISCRAWPTDLHEHEWREHGGCSGLDDDEYFRHALELARGVDAALGARLTTLAGEETTAAALREIADLFHPGLGATLTFHCRTLRDAPSAQPHLIEVRQCVDNDGPKGAPQTPLDCATVKRRDQGCGQHFRIAGARG